MILQTRPNQLGIWSSDRDNVNVDLLVPDMVSGTGGTRGARIPGHSKHAARKTKGLEGALVDKQAMIIKSFETIDERCFEISVAGPTALLVAKLHKIGERREMGRSLSNKDSLDVYQLLQSTATEDFVEVFIALDHDTRSKQITYKAVVFLRNLFSSTTADGSRLAAQAVEGLADPDEVAQSCAFLANDLLARLRDVLPDLFAVSD